MCGLALQHAAPIQAAAGRAVGAVQASDLLSKLTGAQLVLGLLHLGLARAATRTLPRRLYLHMAIRVVDLAVGGALTDVLLCMVRSHLVSSSMDTLHLPSHPPCTPHPCPCFFLHPPGPMRSGAMARAAPASPARPTPPCSPPVHPPCRDYHRRLLDGTWR